MSRNSSPRAVAPTSTFALPTQILLRRIDRVCRARGWTDGYFGKRAVNSTVVVPALKTHGRIWIITTRRIEQFVNAQEKELGLLSLEEGDEASKRPVGP